VPTSHCALAVVSGQDTCVAQGVGRSVGQAVCDNPCAKRRMRGTIEDRPIDTAGSHP